ncbi:hypothetical protein [Micromonospora sp. NPDC049662]|uniref:hypothetical protein n=1 Tax=Micromonospora sp. NPDC049662 TaxID=3155397 RepID=UPI00342E2917
MLTEPVSARRLQLIDDLEGLPGSSDGCLLALTLDAPIFVQVGDFWWVEDDALCVARGEGAPMLYRGRLEWRRKR